MALEITQSTLPGFAAALPLLLPPRGARGRRSSWAATARPTRYLPQSVDRFVTPAELATLMERVGLRGVTYRRLGLGTVTIHTGIA